MAAPLVESVAYVPNFAARKWRRNLGPRLLIFLISGFKNLGPCGPSETDLKGCKFDADELWEEFALTHHLFKPPSGFHIPYTFGHPLTAPSLR